MNWIGLSIFSLIFTICSTILLKYLFTKISEYSMLYIGIYTTAIVFFLVSIYLLFFKKTNKIVKDNLSPFYIFLTLLFLIFTLFGFLFSAYAIKKSPNPGYVIGITSIAALFCSLIAKFLLKEPLSILKTVGLVTIFIGTIIVII